MNKCKKALIITTFVFATLILTNCKNKMFSPKVQLEFQKEKGSKEDLIFMIEDKLDEIPFYSEYFDDIIYTYKEIYFEFIKDYLDKYYSYMSDEQIDQLLDAIEDTFPNYDYTVYDNKREIEQNLWNNFKEKLFYVEDESGLYRAFSLSSSIYSLEEVDFNVVDRFEILSNFVGYEKMLTALFQQNPENLIDVISKETYTDKEEVKRLVQLFNNYFEYREYEDGSGMLEDILGEMDLIITTIFKNKSYCDLEFRYGLYAKAFQNSKYLKNDGLSFSTNYYDNELMFEVDLEDYGKTEVTLPYYYLNSTLDQETLLDSAAIFIFRDAYQEQYYNYYFTKAVTLLSYIVDWNHIDYIANSLCSDLERKKEYYHCLNTYFKTEEDFNQFVVALCSQNENAIRLYFEIWKSKMMNGTITIDKLMEFCSLKSQVLSSYYVSAQDARIIEKDSLEARQLDYSVKDYYFSNNYDSAIEFDEVLDYFHNSGNLYTEVLSDGYGRRNFRTGEREFYSVSDLDVLSTPLQVHRKQLGNGHFICYFIKPKEYPKGKFVSVFTNLCNQRVSSYLDGIETTLVDETTGEVHDVIIVSIDQESPVHNVYFKGNYFDLYPKEKVQMKEYNKN